MKMNRIVLVLLIATATMGFDMDQNMKKYAEECAKENNVDISAFKPGERPDPKMFKEKAFNCFVKCVAVKAGFCSEDGEPNIETIKKMFNPPEEHMKQVKACAADNKQADSCDRVSKIHECIMKNVKKP